MVLGLDIVDKLLDSVATVAKSLFDQVRYSSSDEWSTMTASEKLVRVITQANMVQASYTRMI